MQHLHPGRLPTCGTGRTGRRKKGEKGKSIHRTTSVLTSLGLQQLAADVQAGQLTSVNEQRGSESESQAILVLSVRVTNPSVSAGAQPPRDPRGAYLIPLDVNIY